jgi:hypothetical protein
MRHSVLARSAVLLASFWLGGSAVGQISAQITVLEAPAGRVHAAVGMARYEFAGWIDYFRSDLFREQGMRCGEPRLLPPAGPALAVASDCGGSVNVPRAEYDPSVVRYRIPVVVHILRHSDGRGSISDALVQSQIEVLNEDFLALPGSNGAPGTACGIEFYLADRDPAGHPTSGILRHTNDSWYDDVGDYWTPLHWDTNRYLNIYTNTASGYLGYSYLPNGGGVVGETFDRVVCHWRAFGRDAPRGPPYDQGRTVTHEVGHYLGLRHTFAQGCAVSGDCSTEGDLICDTNDENGSTFGCPTGQSSCNSLDPIHNYMDYTDDLCMWEFSPEQAGRMRCTLENYRMELPEAAFSLGAVPSLAGFGDKVTLATRAGTPGSPAILFLVDVNDLPFFRAVAAGALDGKGSWNLTGAVPAEPNLPGNLLSLRAFCFDPAGRIVMTAPEDLAIQ